MRVLGISNTLKHLPHLVAVFFYFSLSSTQNVSLKAKSFCLTVVLKAEGPATVNEIWVDGNSNEK